MTIPTPDATPHPRRVPRWLTVLAVIAVAGLLIVLLALLLRNLGPETEVWLRIAPAAATVDQTTTIALSSGGWRRNEQVAICLNRPDDEACGAESALQVGIADPDGALEISMLAGTQLAEGRTTFLARGLESGRQTSRSFRILRAPDTPQGAAGTATSVTPGAVAGLTPIPGAEPSDVLPPAGGSIDAGNGVTIDPAAPPFPDWRGEYFTNPDLAGEPALVRNDPDPNLDWGEGSPAPGVIPNDGFSARWSRGLNFAPGLYRFVLTAQDGGRLLVEGQPVIDAWQGAEGQTVTVDRSLSGGQYQVVVHFRNLTGPANIGIGWSPLATPTPVQIAGVDPTPTPGSAPTSTPTAVPTDISPTATPTLGSGAPGATETVLPTSSVTASATETGAPPGGTATPEATPGTPTATPGTPTTTPGTPTATPGTPTTTPGPGATGTPQRPPGSEKMITINLPDGPPGQSIEISSVDWSPGTVLQVSLGQFNTSYTEARPLSGVSYTTPIDRSRPWDWPLRFSFPNEPPWSNATLPVFIWVHNGDWSEWGMEVFAVIP